MKALHRPDFWGWSEFNPERNLDFHSVLWQSPAGNIAFDPLPLSAHDQAHLQTLGGVQYILLTNSDHIRAALALKELTGAEIWGPAGEADSFPLACERWLDDGEEALPGVEVFALNGSKTPGELAFLIQGHTLISGDLIRAHQAGKLCLLPDPKLSDKAAAQESLRQLANFAEIEAVLTGDGWPVFRQGLQALRELIATL